MFILTNGSQFIKTNTKLTPHIKEAKKYPNIVLADKARVNMKRTFKKMGNWRIVEYEDAQQSDTIDSNGKVMSVINLEDKSMTSYDLAENISSNYKKLISYKAILENTIHEKEKETQDLLHFIEFFDLDAYKGFLIYKKLQQVRNERRKAKDELSRVDNFLKADLQTVSDWKTDTKEKKTYTPRVLVELFKHKWKRHEERETENEKS